jgi:hypothetical protein
MLIKFYKVIAVPLCTYENESWALNRSEMKKMKTAEMHFLRPASGCTLTDRSHNTKYAVYYKYVLQKKESKTTKQMA